MRCIAIAAITIDGKTALDANHFSDWTSPEDKVFMRALLDKSDVVVVGNNTYKTAVEPLSKRNCIVLTSSVAATERKNEKLLLWNPTAVPYSSVLQNTRIEKVAVLGGTQTYTYFLENDLLDEIYLTIEPLVFGRGLHLFESQKNLSRRFRLESTKLLNEKGSLLLHYVKD
ncbi:MAG TPA: dihydrofolate reductase family protein [Candidatus Paceibacterota bacterium]